MNRGQGGHEGLTKAIRILKTLAQAEDALGVTEIGKRVGVSKATVYRLLTTMTLHGLVSQDFDTKRYRLGPDLAALGYAALRDFDIQREARPVLKRLADEVEMPAFLNVSGVDEVVCIEHVDSQNQIKVYGRAGRTMPFHACPSGILLMAHANEETRTRLRIGPLPALASKTITDPVILSRASESANEQGFAFGENDLEEGVASIAAPIRDPNGVVTATVSVAGFSPRFEAQYQHTLAAVLEAARAISARNQRDTTTPQARS